MSRERPPTPLTVWSVDAQTPTVALSQVGVLLLTHTVLYILKCLTVHRSLSEFKFSIECSAQMISVCCKWKEFNYLKCWPPPVLLLFKECRRESTHISCRPAESPDRALKSRFVAASPAVLQCMPMCPPPVLWVTCAFSTHTLIYITNCSSDWFNALTWCRAGFDHTDSHSKHAHNAPTAQLSIKLKLQNATICKSLKPSRFIYNK